MTEPTKRGRPRKFDVPLNTGTFSHERIERFNREHDQRYGWDWRQPHLYSRSDTTWKTFAPPGFDKHRPDEECDLIVWAWHNRVKL